MGVSLQSAVALAELGWSVLPVRHGEKRPSLASWSEYQERVPTEAELREWFKSDIGLCVVCGSVSGNLAVLDFDTEGAYEQWSQAWPEVAAKLPTSKSGRGFHVFLSTPEPVPSTGLFIKDFKGKAGDVLGEGKVCVLPPTKHPSGALREWIRRATGPLPCMTLDKAGVVPIRLVEGTEQGSYTTLGEILSGDRHNRLKALAAKLRGSGHGFGFIRDMLLAVNESRCQPPLPNDEVRNLADWASKLPCGRPSHIDNPWEDDDRNIESVLPEQTYREDDERFEGMFRDAPDYLKDLGLEPMPFVVEGLLAETYLTILGGTSKAGKSCLMSAIGIAVASGVPFMGLTVAKGPVLWVAYEESERERALCLKEFGQVPSGFWISHNKLLIDTDEGIEGLRYWIRKTGARLVILDALYGAVGVDNLSEGRKARAALSTLKELCRTEGICCVLLHHFNKGVGNGREKFADSNQILATASMDLRMEVHEQSDGIREIRLSGTGRGDFANREWVIRSRGVSEYELVAVGNGSEVSSLARDTRILDCIAEFGSEGVMAARIAQDTDVPIKTVQNALTGLVRDGRVVSVGRNKNAKLYALPGQEDVLAA